MSTSRSLLAAVLLAACSATAPSQASETPLTDCLDLSSGYQVTRFGTQYLLLKDGEDHYRLGFSGGSCDAIAVSTQVQIATEGQSNRLCPAKTQVRTKRDSCVVREVVPVDADEYERYARRNRR